VILSLTRSYRWVVSFATICLVIRYCLVYWLFICLHCLFSVVIVRRRWLWEPLRVRRAWFWAAASRRVRQVTLDHIDHMCYLSLFSIHTDLHALILLPKPHTLGSWVHTWLVCLAMQSWVSCKSSIFMMLSMPCVLVWEMWCFIRWDVIWPCDDWCYGLSNDWNGGDG
jgi:hypothetical protein